MTSEYTLVIFCLLGSISILIPYFLLKKSKLISALFLAIGLLFIVFFLIISLFLFVITSWNLGPEQQIFLILFLGLLIGSISFTLVYQFEIYKAIRDIGIKNIPHNWLDTLKYTKINRNRFNDQNQLKYLGIHSAAIIALTPGFRGEMVFSCGIDLLKDYHRKVIHRPFYAYICTNRDQVQAVICNKKVDRVWIFGHGTYYGLNVGNDFIKYIEFKNAPKKDFIGQFHCNSHADCGVSLAELILKSNGRKFVKEGYRSTHLNRNDIEYWNKLNWNC